MVSEAVIDKQAGVIPLLITAGKHPPILYFFFAKLVIELFLKFTGMKQVFFHMSSPQLGVS
jgi:hypothetical protein